LIATTLVLAKMHPLKYDQWPVTFWNGVVRAIILAAFGACVLFITRVTSEKRRVLLCNVMLLIIFTDARTHTVQQNPSLPTHVLAPGFWPEATRQPAPRHGQSRVFITPQAEERLLFNQVRNGMDEFLGQRLALWSNLNLLDDIPKVNGSSTLQVKEQMQLQKRLYEQTNSLPAGLLDFLCVSHLSSPDSVVDWVRHTNFCEFITGGQEPEFHDDQSALRRLMDTQFNPRRTVFLPEELKGRLTATNSTVVKITRPEISAHRIRFGATADAAGLCVIPQSFYHCWKGFVDGKPTPLLRANVAFQAIAVPAGEHEVTLLYRDPLLLAGAAITLFTGITCWLLWRRWRDLGKEKAA
jgi:hypothetical protein